MYTPKAYPEFESRSLRTFFAKNPFLICSEGVFLVFTPEKVAPKMHRGVILAQCKNPVVLHSPVFWLGADTGGRVLTNYLIANCLCVLLPAKLPGVKHINN